MFEQDPINKVTTTLLKKICRLLTIVGCLEPTVTQQQAHNFNEYSKVRVLWIFFAINIIMYV